LFGFYNPNKGLELRGRASNCQDEVSYTIMGLSLVDLPGCSNAFKLKRTHLEKFAAESLEMRSKPPLCDFLTSWVQSQGWQSHICLATDEIAMDHIAFRRHNINVNYTNPR